MDSKLMLVFTFTTIVVVAGYPSDPYTDFATLLSPAKSQTITYEDCFYLTFAPQVRFCLKYYFSESSKECKYRKANKFRKL